MKRQFIIAVLVLLLCGMCLGAASTVYVTPTGAGAEDGTSWEDACDMAGWLGDMTDNAEANDIYYVAGGTYTLTGNFSSTRSATYNENIITVIGVKSGTTAEPPTTADWAYGDDRPLINAGAYTFSWVASAQSWAHRNFRFTAINVKGWQVYRYTLFSNCAFANTNTGNCARASNVARYEDCTFTSPGGVALYVTTSPNIINCTITNSGYGIYLASHYVRILGCTIDTCTTAGIRIQVLGGDMTINNNTIYNCGVCIDTPFAVYMSGFRNNIVSGCTTGVSWVSAVASNNWDYNCWDNTTDFVNVTAGPHSLVATDPCFVDAGDGDFELLVGSPCIGASDNGGVIGAGLITPAIQGDLNYDGGVNLVDFAIFAGHWLEGVAP